MQHIFVARQIRHERAQIPREIAAIEALLAKKAQQFAHRHVSTATTNEKWVGVNLIDQFIPFPFEYVVIDLHAVTPIDRLQAVTKPPVRVKRSLAIVL